MQVQKFSLEFVLFFIDGLHIIPHELLNIDVFVTGALGGCSSRRVTSTSWPTSFPSRFRLAYLWVLFLYLIKLSLFLFGLLYFFFLAENIWRWDLWFGWGSWWFTYFTYYWFWIIKFWGSWSNLWLWFWRLKSLVDLLILSLLFKFF